MKRRIAISLECPLMQYGGVEVLIQGLLEGLADAYEIILVSGDKSLDEIPRPYRDFVAGHIHWPRQVTYAASLALARELRKQKVEFIHFNFGGVYGYGARIPGRCPVIACSWLGIPSMTTVHLVESTYEGYLGPQKPRWIKQAFWPLAWFSRLLTLLSAKKEFAVSNHDRDRMQQWFGPWQHRISRIYHSRIKEGEERPVDSAPREPVILSVGTLGPRKGQPFLVRAFAQIAQKHPQWKLVIMGRANDEATARQIREEIERTGLGDRVTWTGPVSSEAIVDMMYRASVFGMPSLEEGLGLSLQEALYRGCPAVGSRVGGIPELIDDESNGLLVPPGDVDKLAAALDRVLSDDALRHRLAAQARPSVIRKGMTQRLMVDNYRRIYDSYLSH